MGKEVEKVKNVNENFRDAIRAAVAISLRSGSVINSAAAARCRWADPALLLALGELAAFAELCSLLGDNCRAPSSARPHLQPAALISAAQAGVVLDNLHFKGQLEARAKCCLLDAGERPSRTVLLCEIVKLSPDIDAEILSIRSGTSSSWMIVYRNDTPGAAVAPWR